MSWPLSGDGGGSAVAIARRHLPPFHFSGDILTLFDFPSLSLFFFFFEKSSPSGEQKKKTSSQCRAEFRRAYIALL